MFLAYQLPFYTIGILGILLNFLLLAVILRCRSPFFATFSFVLFNCSLVDLFSIIMGVLIEVRLIAASPMYIVIPGGLCSLASAHFCYLCYCTYLSTINQQLAMLGMSFWYRLYVLSHPPPTRRFLMCMIILIALPSAITAAAYATREGRAEPITRRFLELYPDSQIEGLMITGNESTGGIAAWSTAYNCYLPFVTYAFIITIRFCVLRKLKQLTAKMSIRTKRSHEQLIMALTIHALLPMISVTGGAAFFLEHFDVFHHPVLEYGCYLLLMIPPSVNPVVILGFVTPYRRFLSSIADNISTPFKKSSARIEQTIQIE